jgi:uncharacterized protein with WD repeat
MHRINGNQSVTISSSVALQAAEKRVVLIGLPTAAKTDAKYGKLAGLVKTKVMKGFPIAAGGVFSPVASNGKSFGCALVQFADDAGEDVVSNAVSKAGVGGIKVMKFVIRVMPWLELFSADEAAAPAEAAESASAPAPAAAPAPAPEAASASAAESAAAAEAASYAEIHLPGLPKHMQSACAPSLGKGDRGSELLNKAYKEVMQLGNFVPQQKREPKLSLDKCVVVTGLPIVPDTPGTGKSERLETLVREKAFSRLPIATGGFYMPGGPEGNTVGVAVVEFTRAAAVAVAVKASGRTGIKLAKSVTIHVAGLRELIESYDTPEAPELPTIRPLAPPKGMLQWLADGNQRDQALFRFEHRKQNSLHIVAADSQQAPEVVYDGKDQEEASGSWTHGRSEWSPNGTYLITYHNRGIKLWGGDRFKAVASLPHDNVVHFQLNAAETLAITYSPFVPSDPDSGAPYVEPLTKVWDLRLGLCLEEWTTLNRGEAPTEPDSFFVCDGTHIVRVAKTGFKLANGDERDSGLIGYAVNAARGTVSLLPGGVLRIPSVFKVWPSPAGLPVVAVYSPEHEGAQPSVSIVTVPLMHILREKKLVDTMIITPYWHPEGRYLALPSVSLTRNQASHRRKEFLRNQTLEGVILPPPEVSFLRRPRAGRVEAMKQAVTEGASTTIEVFRFDRPKLRQIVAAASTGAELDAGLIPVDVVTMSTHIYSLGWEPKGSRFAVVHGKPSEPATVTFMSVGEESVAHSTGLAVVAKLRGDLKEAAAEPNLTTSIVASGIIRTDAAPLATATAAATSVTGAGRNVPIGSAPLGSGGRAGGRAGSRAGGRTGGRGGPSKAAVAASKAAAAEARARGVNHLFSLTDCVCNSVFWSSSSGVCVMADTGARASGALTFFDVDARFTLGSSQHPGVSHVAFSPSDSVVATMKRCSIHNADHKEMLDNGVRVFDVKGTRLSDPAWEEKEAVYDFVWRPRPVLLSGSELKTVRANLAIISAGFADMDLARERKVRLRALVTRLERINRFEHQLQDMRTAVTAVNSWRADASLPALPVGDRPDGEGMVEVVVNEETLLSSKTEEAGSVSITTADPAAIAAAMAALPESILPTVAHQEWLVVAGYALEECALDPSPAMPQESRGVAIKASECLRRAASRDPPDARAVAYEKEVRELLGTPAGSIVARRLAAMLPKPSEGDDASGASSAASSASGAGASSSQTPATGTLVLTQAQRDSLYAAVLLDSICGHIQADSRKHLTPTGGDSPQLGAIFGRVRIDTPSLTTACTRVAASHAQPGIAARLEAIRARLRVSSSGVGNTVAEVADATADVLVAIPTLLDLAEVLAAESSALNSHPFPAGHSDFSEIHRSTKDRIRAASRG